MILSNKVFKRIINTLCVILALYHIVTAINPMLTPVQHANIHLGLSVVVIFLTAMVNSKHKFTRTLFFSLSLISILIFLYIHFSYFQLMDRIGIPTNLDLIIGIALLIVIFESTRQGFGFAMIIFALIAIAYCFAGPFMPGLLNHSGLRWDYIVPSLTTSVAAGGVYSTFLFTSAGLVSGFIIFGAFLGALGAADFFVKVAIALGGRYQAGPALGAIVGSCAVGSINGSAIANVMTTGVFTIPLMKTSGYEPEYAAAVEACASTGGMFMPPVMGVSAFVMASLTGIPYINIAIAAAIPALSYYFILGLSAVLRAKKKNLKTLEEKDIPEIKTVLKNGWYYCIPMVVVTYFLFIGFSPIRSSLFATISLVAVKVIACSIKNPKYVLSKEFRSIMLEGLIDAGKTITTIAACLALMGVITQALVITNLPTKMVFFMKGLTDNLLPAVIMVAGIGIVFGMGVPSVATYVLLAILAAPVLIDLGLSQMATHLFMLYYGVIGNITPPVGGALLVASKLADAKYIKTGIHAMKLGLAAFVLPFYFIFHPAFLLEGAPMEIFWAITTSLLGLSALAFAFEGYTIKPLSWLERAVLALAGCLLIDPGLVSGVLGMSLLLIVSVKTLLLSKRARLQETQP